MSKNYKYFFNPLGMSFGIMFRRGRGVRGEDAVCFVLTPNSSEFLFIDKRNIYQI